MCCSAFEKYHFVVLDFSAAMDSEAGKMPKRTREIAFQNVLTLNLCSHGAPNSTDTRKSSFEYKLLKCSSE